MSELLEPLTASPARRACDVVELRARRRESSIVMRLSRGGAELAGADLASHGWDVTIHDVTIGEVTGAASG